MKQLLLIDANSLIHRCFHALPPLTSPTGAPAGALYGLANILAKIVLQEKPDYAAALFDRPEPTFRKTEYAEYKAHRPKAPNELVSQIIEAHHLFEDFGVRVFEEPGWEADDLIATLAKKFGAEPDLRTVILTGDLDTLQLVDGEKTVVRTFRKGINDTFIYDDAAVRARYGLRPDQVPEYKALVGDASDNIRGVPGVGPKTAADLLTRYGDLSSALASAADDKGLAKIRGASELLELNLRLVTLKLWGGLPVLSLEDLALHADTEKILAYARSQGFSSLERRLLSGSADRPAEAPPKKVRTPKNPNQGSFF